MTALSTPEVRTAHAVRAIEHHSLTWRGIALTVVFTPDWVALDDCRYDHLEVMSEAPRRPLPMTETGYQSLFLPAGEIEGLGGPVAYVTRWLDHAAHSSRWQQVERDARQGCLF
jgi:hypothetical protein